MTNKLAARENYEMGFLFLVISGTLFFAMVIVPGIYLWTEWQSLESIWDCEATAGMIAGTMISVPGLVVGACLFLPARAIVNGEKPAPNTKPAPVPIPMPAAETPATSPEKTTGEPSGPSPLLGILKWGVVACLISFVIAAIAVAMVAS